MPPCTKRGPFRSFPKSSTIQISGASTGSIRFPSLSTAVSLHGQLLALWMALSLASGSAESLVSCRVPFPRWQNLATAQYFSLSKSQSSAP
jgi:hypothetical protein